MSDQTEFQNTTLTLQTMTKKICGVLASFNQPAVRAHAHNWSTIRVASVGLAQKNNLPS
jgi:hypothetical protein